MAVNKIDFRSSSADTSRAMSEAIWADCPRAAIRETPGIGFFFYDDFIDLPLAPTLTTQIAFGRYKAFASSGCTIDKVTPINSVETMGGTLKLSIDTDNDSASLAFAYPYALLSGLTSNSGKTWFECCIAQKSVATNMASTIIGLAETEQWTLATGVPLNGGDSPTNAASFIGFQVPEDGLGAVNTCYSDRATSFTAIQSTITTLAAYTFTKLGIVYDPFAAGADCIQFYVNGVKTSTNFSKSALQALTNLDANGLAPIIATCADSGGTAHDFYMKWWSWAGLFPSAY
jgi:hypothetical protein